MYDAQNSPWTRKHDDPRFPLFPSGRHIVYPSTLEELRAVCANPNGDQRLKAAGSHYALSPAAISPDVFIETHDPNERFPAMGASLATVLPKVLSEAQLEKLAQDHTGEGDFLVQFESGKRVYQAYAELDDPMDTADPETLAGWLNIRYINPSYAGPWAFETLGSAGGQTVVGAFSTGTHGGDVELPPTCDSVQAIHLVSDGGAQHWIEPEISNWGVPLTDDARLRAVYGDDLEIIRDNKAFNAALVSVGRFGVIYSVVIRVVRAYALRQQRELSTWETVKPHIKDETSTLYVDANGTKSRFLQIAVCLTPYGFDSNLAGITRRWATASGTWPGRAERIGIASDDLDPVIAAHRYSMAGVSHSFVDDSDHPERSGDPDPLAQFCANGSFLVGVIDEVAKELEKYVESHGTVIGATIAAVAVTVGGAALDGLLAFLAVFALIALALRELLKAIGSDDRLGELFDKVRGVLLNPDNPDPISRAAGVFTWRMIAFLAFRSQQAPQDYTAQSYAVLDQHDYLDQSCNVNVDSVEVFFDAEGDEVIAFVDALLAFESAQEHDGKAFIGYASLRFTGKTRALIGMQRWRRTCAVEVSCLRDSDGGQQVVDYAVQLARDPNFAGIMHWGQHNDADAEVTYNAFGQASLSDPSYNDLDGWRDVLRHFTADGQRNAFASDFTDNAGLRLL